MSNRWLLLVFFLCAGVMLSQGQVYANGQGGSAGGLTAGEAEAALAAPLPPKPTGRVCCPKPEPKPYKGVFYDNDFSYLDGPSPGPWRLGNNLKQRRLGPSVTLDVGGEYRIRHENAHILSRNNDFLLHRTRIYANAKVDGWFRAYVEGIDAATEFDDVSPRAVDENRFDALNLFGDLKLLDGGRGDLWFRGGRQELLYGAQRLVSPLDWSNTRRTFDGLKTFWRGTDWDIDAWWTRPVPFGQHIANDQTDHNFDHPDQSREFSGVWLTRKNFKNQKIDLFYLRYNEYDPAVPTFDYNTFGLRWEGSHGSWLWEIESCYQFGRVAGLPQSAGCYTFGLGYELSSLPMKPVVWAYYDWASGTKDPSGGTNQTFNQLFPLGHKYFGFMDIVGRQNIEDWNFRVVAKPHEKVKLLLWWHIFHLQQPRDSLYNAGGVPILTDPTGAAGRDVGQELDFDVVFLLTPRCDLLFGYSHLFPGTFIRDTLAGPIGTDFYYGQCRLRF